MLEKILACRCPQDLRVRMSCWCCCRCCCCCCWKVKRKFETFINNRLTLQCRLNFFFGRQICTLSFARLLFWLNWCCCWCICCCSCCCYLKVQVERCQIQFLIEFMSHYKFCQRTFIASSSNFAGVKCEVKKMKSPWSIFTAHKNEPTHLRLIILSLLKNSGWKKQPFLPGDSRSDGSHWQRGMDSIVSI